MHRIALVLACVLLAACNEPPAATPAPAKTGLPAKTPPAGKPSTTLTCDWPGFARNNSVGELKQTFGAANIRVLDEEEGITTVLVFPDDPRRAMQLNLSSESAFQGASVDERASTWTIPGGVGMGAGVADVERANGRPFKLLVHAGGASSQDWNGGALGEGGCSFWVSFEHGDKSITAQHDAMSDDPALRALGLKVYRFGVN